MGLRFLGSFLIALTLTLAALAGVGWAVAKLVVATPGEQFSTGYFSFDLAAGWRCELDGNEFICHPPGTQPYAAIAIIAMKERGPEDRLEKYEQHLRSAEPVSLADGSKTVPEVRFVRRTTLGHQQWVEGLQVGSEVANFHTYYLATTTSHVGILVTLSVHKDYADAYFQQLKTMMASLSVYQR